MGDCGARISNRKVLAPLLRIGDATSNAALEPDGSIKLPCREAVQAGMQGQSGRRRLGKAGAAIQCKRSSGCRLPWRSLHPKSSIALGTVVECILITSSHQEGGQEED